MCKEIRFVFLRGSRWRLKYPLLLKTNMAGSLAWLNWPADLVHDRLAPDVCCSPGFRDGGFALEAKKGSVKTERVRSLVESRVRKDKAFFSRATVSLRQSCVKFPLSLLTSFLFLMIRATR